MYQELLEITPMPQTEAILECRFADKYPIDTKERLRYLADHYHALPLEVAIHDTLLTSAMRADEWVAQRNKSSGSKTHTTGNVDALTNALSAIGSEADVAASNPTLVKNSIRNEANGLDSFGDEILGQEGFKWRAIAFHNNVEKANISDDIKDSLRHVFQAEAAKRHIVRELEAHWAGFPTESFPFSALTRVSGNSDPHNRMNGYWLGRTIGFTRNGIGLLAAYEGMKNHLEEAYLSIYRDATQRKISLGENEANGLIEQMKSVVNLRTSNRANKETASELRLPILDSFHELDSMEVQRSLEDLWLHNPTLFTAASFRLLGLDYSDVDIFKELTDEEGKYNEDIEADRIAELHAEHQKFLEDCKDPELLQFAYEQLGGKIIAMPQVERKYGGGLLRYVQKGSKSNTAREGEPHEVLILRRLVQDNEGRLNVKFGGAAIVTTSSVLRRFMLGQVKILDDMEVDPNWP